MRTIDRLYQLADERRQAQVRMVEEDMFVRHVADPQWAAYQQQVSIQQKRDFPTKRHRQGRRWNEAQDAIRASEEYRRYFEAINALREAQKAYSDADMALCAAARALQRPIGEVS